MNLLENPTLESLIADQLVWSPPPLRWEALEEGGMRVHVPEKVDYFQDPGGQISKDDAPYLSLPVSGDFVVQARVRPNWQTVWDAAAIMVRHDARSWAKLCFESTDIGTKAAVSVVMRGASDDANGADLDISEVWLQVCRIGQVFGMHYSLDGQSWRMVRVFRLDVPEEVRVGLVAQCPAGLGAAIDWLSLSVEQRTVANIRAGK